MKISELLREGEENPKKPAHHSKIKPTSRLGSAPSIDDKPVDDDQTDSETDNTEDQTNDLDPAIIDNLKRYAGDLGGDLYSVTIYNTSDDFAGIEPISDVVSALEDLDSAVVAKYIDQDVYDISENKVITALIYNDRNGKCFVFSAAADGGGIEPPIATLLNKGVIDDDQTSILETISQSGKRYTSLLKNVRWKSGAAPVGRNAEDMLGALDALKSDLNLREFKNKSYSQLPRLNAAERQAQASSHNAMLDYMKAKREERRAAKAQK